MPDSLVRRVSAATPADRDRALDALRALAILGVVLGHWLVTALVGEGGTLHGASPLSDLPWLAPVSWLFQTLAVFFLVSGYVTAKGWASASAPAAGTEGRSGPVGAGGRAYRAWLRARLARLFRPVAALLALWAVATLGLLATGADLGTVRTLLKLVLSPLWFLLVLAALTALTPLVARLHPLWPLAAVIHVDLVRFGLGGPDWLGWINLAAGWLVPYCLGAGWARGASLGDTGPRGAGPGGARSGGAGLGGAGLGGAAEVVGGRAPYGRGAEGRRRISWRTAGVGGRTAGVGGRATGWTLLLGGTVATAGLVVLAGYPASMVGVPGAEVSNLNPPTLAAVTFGLAQCGAALLLHGPLTRAMRRPLLWTGVALANLSALTVFLWHQTALLVVTALGLLTGRPLPGLHTAPDDPAWILHRLAWLPLFAAVLAVCWAAFRGAEHGRRRSRGGTTVVRVHRPAPRRSETPCLR
ncbi:acyltransferase family protein [Streptomyces sp. Da 82-17]|uniref:acyltransferase family protein n=1 Tax=Streptomyces sp. Da 82-17 TaxID=3377116 RepID=UPI0038D45A28